MILQSAVQADQKGLTQQRIFAVKAHLSSVPEHGHVAGSVMKGYGTGGVGRTDDSAPCPVENGRFAPDPPAAQIAHLCSSKQITFGAGLCADDKTGMQPLVVLALTDHGESTSLVAMQFVLISTGGLFFWRP